MNEPTVPPTQPKIGSETVSEAGASPSPVVLVTGMSGAGRSTALKILEDLGYEAVDNLPLSLMPVLVMHERRRRVPCAVGVDIRNRDFGVARFLETLDDLRITAPGPMCVIYMDCDDEVLRRRFTETRRPHPIDADLPLTEAIGLERRQLDPIAAVADMRLDSSDSTPRDLRCRLSEAFALTDAPKGMAVFVKSFSYRKGLPREADIVIDVRFLRNPYYDPALRPLTGQDPTVGAYVARDPQFAEFFNGLTGLIGPLLPRYAEEGKSYLTVAIGCTGGRHRSVFVAERLAVWVKEQGREVHLSHRDALCR